MVWRDQKTKRLWYLRTLSYSIIILLGLANFVAQFIIQFVSWAALMTIMSKNWGCEWNIIIKCSSTPTHVCTQARTYTKNPQNFFLFLLYGGSKNQLFIGCCLRNSDGKTMPAFRIYLEVWMHLNKAFNLIPSFRAHLLCLFTDLETAVFVVFGFAVSNEEHFRKARKFKRFLYFNNIHIVNNLSSFWSIQLDNPCILRHVTVLVSFIRHSISPFLLIQQAFHKMSSLSVFVCPKQTRALWFDKNKKKKYSNGASG